MSSSGKRPAEAGQRSPAEPKRSSSSAAGKAKGKSKSRDQPQAREVPRLHKAAGEGDFRKVLQLLATEDIDAKTREKHATALMHACNHGHYMPAAVLLEHGADITIVDSEGRTALHHAAYSGIKSVIALCLRYGANYSAKDRKERMPHQIMDPKNKKLKEWYISTVTDKPILGKNDIKLLGAIQSTSEVKVLEHLDKDRTTEVCSEEGIYALTWAVRQGKIDIVDLLLLHCADVNQTDPQRNTALHWAAIKGQVEIARLLINNYALLNLPNRETLFTPLHLAASKGHDEIVRLLLNAGADPSVLDKDDLTPLHWACRQGKAECVMHLVRKGAEVNAQDAFGVTPLHLAVHAGSVEIVNILATVGHCDLDAATSTSRTALLTAASSGDASMCRVLVGLGARANAVNKEGNAALHIAAQEVGKQEDAEDALCYVDTIQALVTAGADLEVRNNKQQTPIQMMDVKKMLRRASAEHNAAIVLVKGKCDLSVFLRAPVIQDHKDLVNMLRSEVAAENMEMPEGWKRKNTKTLRQREYFVNRDSRVTQWEDPRLAAAMVEVKAQAAQNNNSSLVMDNFTCPLCLDLLFKPVTTVCGHSFCQQCLVGAVRFNTNCPMCRKELKYSSDDHAINTLLADIIASAFPEQYEARTRDFQAIGS